MELTRHEITEVLRSAMENDEPVVLSPAGLLISFFCSLKEVSDDFLVIDNPIKPEYLPYVLAAKSFGLHCRAYRLESEKLIPFGTAIRFPIPHAAQRGAARQLDRTSYFKQDDAFVRIEHPFDKGTVLTRPLYDLSTDGMSFRARMPTPFLQPGRELPLCRVFLQGKFHSERSGRIVYVKQIIDLQGHSYFQVGVKFLSPGELTE